MSNPVPSPDDDGICPACGLGDGRCDCFDPYCHRCDNSGFVIVCVDDMCRGAGECMHGDGEIVCPDCKGNSGDW